MGLTATAVPATMTPAAAPKKAVGEAWDAESLTLAAAVSRASQAARGDCAGRLLWVEHLNLVVGDRRLAEAFYFEEGLGCTRDPSKPGGSKQTSGTMWANLGWQQFHLAQEAPDDPPQAVRGAIGLALPRADEAAARLERLQASEEHNVEVRRHAPGRFTARCPWGNVFHCYDADAFRSSPERSGHDDFAVDDAAAPKMARIHAGRDASLAVRGGPGIRYVLTRCADADAVADAYRRTLGQAVLSVADDDDDDDDEFLRDAEATRAARYAVVAAGVGPVHLVFETADEQDGRDADARMQGVHACVYVDDFAATYADLQDHVFTNPRFKHLDTCDTLDDALRSRTFRFAFPDAPDLEHETRSLAHNSFLKHIRYDGPP